MLRTLPSYPESYSILTHSSRLVNCYFGDPWENRTPVCGVRGRCLNRLTNGPWTAFPALLDRSALRATAVQKGLHTPFGSPVGCRLRRPAAFSRGFGIRCACGTECLLKASSIYAVLSPSGLSTLRSHLSLSGAPSGTRTRDPLIKSQLLYQLS